MTEFKHIIEEVCTKTDRTDLINKIKIVRRRSDRQAYIGNMPVFGNACFDFRKNRKQPTKIILQPIYDYIYLNRIKDDVIRHELCHIIDAHSINDITLKNGGHGESFNRIMNKIECKMYYVDISYVDHPHRKLLESKVLFKARFSPFLHTKFPKHKMWLSSS